MFRRYLLFYLFVLTFEQNNWTMANNAIKININSYKNELINIDDYSYWTDLRNALYYSQNTNQLEKLVKYFTPEEENYYKNLFNFSAPGFVLTACVIVVLIIYLVNRFLFKGCKGPKKVAASYHYTTYFLIIFGCSLGLTFHILFLYNATVSK